MISIGLFIVGVSCIIKGMIDDNRKVNEQTEKNMENAKEMLKEQNDFLKTLSKMEMKKRD